MDGSDAASGTSRHPFATIDRALEKAVAGDTILVRPGRHQGFDIKAAGRADAPITILGDPSGEVVVDGRLGRRSNTIRVLAGSAFVAVDGLIVTGSSGYRSAGILVEGVTRGPIVVTRSRLTRNDGYGMLIVDSRDVIVADNQVDHDRSGVEIDGDGAGVIVRGNRIHDHDRLVRATPRRVDPNDDYGATGVALVRTIGPVLVEGNQIWGNRARSSDYRWDGSGVEIFAASGITIRDNVLWDNENVLETGTADGMPCADNVFSHNLAWGEASAGHARGVILRCGERMVMANDTLVDLDDYALMLGAGSALFSGSIAGVHIVNELLVMTGPGAPLVVTSELPEDLVIEHSLLWNDRGPVADVMGKGTTNSLARAQRWTGTLSDSIVGAPRFEDPLARDYRLSAVSPAIDAGVAVTGITDTWTGSAPDLGAIETP
jgi:hypothetical protein